MAGLLAACQAQAGPSTLPPGATRQPPVTVIIPDPTITPIPPTSTPEPTSTPVPIELVVCQQAEPVSLFLYGGDVSARAGIFEALYDGPIDAVGFAYQPVILERLPSLENGTAFLHEVEVRPGDRVVDALTGGVVSLAEGVLLAQVDGSLIPYAGAEPARTLQIEALFSLRPDLLWSDGQRLTADDSVFSFEVAASPDTPQSKFITDRTARYEAADERTVRWVGLPGWLDTQFYLRFWTPLPRHRYGGLSPLELQSSAEAAGDGLGWGPFTLAEWARGDHMTLVRNPLYFRTAEGLPRVDRVVFRFGLDASAILAEMQAGRCDIGLSGVDFGEQLAYLVEQKAAGSLAPQFAGSTTFEHLDFGIEPAEGYKRGAGLDLFQDVRVRQAFAYCLDRQAIVDQMLYGLSETPAAYLPSTHPLYAADRVALYPFNPEQGRALLEAAGWTDQDGDGVREQDRRRLALDYASGPPGSPFREALMGLVQAQLLANCGVEVRPALQPVEGLYAPWPGGTLFGRQFDLGQFPWRAGAEPPCELYLSEAIPSSENPGGANDIGYRSPAFDQACQVARHALDEAVRRAAHAEAQAVFTQDLPSIPLFWRLKIGVALPRVAGYQLDATAQDLWNIESISLPQP